MLTENPNENSKRETSEKIKNCHNTLLTKAARWLLNASEASAFTGAGISVESGIPPFRGPTGIWSKFDPSILDINRYFREPENVWPVIKKIFYDHWGKAEPNQAHYNLAKMQEMGIIKDIITQNIDNLHQKAGSKNVWEFHGTLTSFTCQTCHFHKEWNQELLYDKPPICPSCNSILKPDFVFFGEGIPPVALKESLRVAEQADILLIIGTTGEIMPASQIPFLAKKNGAKIIEININPSNYTNLITDVFLQGKASEIMTKLVELMLKLKQ
ncbi:MAG: NAD-dependent deacylase [Candidatus Lokiarchaeota archaeon]|nr:NAD-dependent deacylase [Candidatus Harpocratesius repetitus]